MVTSRKNRIISILIAFMVVFGTFIFTPEKASAESVYINFAGQVYSSYGDNVAFMGNQHGIFTTNFGGGIVHCTEHEIAAAGGLTGPGTSATLDFQEYSASSLVRKILYYGWGGPAQWSGFSTYASGYWNNMTSAADAQACGVGITNNALTYAYGGQGKYFEIYGFWDFINYCNGQPDPPSSFKVYRFYDATLQDMLTWKLVPMGKVTITKTSANTGITNANSSYSLSGAVYDLYSGSTRIASVTTDSNGKATFPAVEYGTYTIKERTPSKGYALDTSSHSVNINAENVSVTLKEVPQSSVPSLLVRKFDEDLNKATQQGNATLAGAQYTVKFYPGQYTSTSDLPASATRTWVFKTNADGEIHFTDNATHFVRGSAFYKNSAGNIVLPLGTITIQETKAPTGYLADDTVYLKRITSSGTAETVNTYSYPTSKDPVQRGQFTITKTDVETGTNEQGDATFAGAEFSIINDSTNSVVVDGKTYAKGQVCKVITTDANGVATTGAGSLPYGSYIVKETKPPAGYLNTGTTERSFSITQNNQHINFTTTPMINDVIRGGFLIEKWDKEFDKPEPSVETSLLGIEFTVTNKSEHPVIVGGVEYAPDEIITKLYTEWNEEEQSYTVQVPDDYLPYGTYHVTETATNNTYVLTDGEPKVVKIREDGVIVTTDQNDNPLIYKNYTIRNDFKFIKQDANTGDELANIPFKITNLETGETHVIVSDENGLVSTESSHNLHSTKTNANDNLLTLDTITEADVDPSAGVWFSKGTEGSVAAPIDEQPALPYGEYQIDELRCEKNQNRDLIEEVTISVYRDPSDGHGVLDLGVMTNHHTVVDTLAKDKDMDLKGSTPQDSFARDEITIVDDIEYSGVEIGKEYTLTTTAVNASTGTPVMKGDSPAETVTVFTPEKTSGDLTVELEVDLAGLSGDKIVVHQLLTYEEGGQIYTAAIHADNHDRDQTINLYAPELKTTALNAETNERITATGNTVITDRVEYSGLMSGQTYTVRGMLVNEKGEPILRNGVAVTASETFYANRKSGEITITFPEIDTTGFEGKTITVFEELIWNGETVGEHKELSDEMQQIQFPKISTSALDSETKDHIARPDENVEITDTVSCRNLISGRTYRLEAVLMDKDTNEPLEINGKKVTAEKTFIPDEEDCDVDVVFNIDASSLAGKTAVVYETLYLGDLLLTSHENILDKAQTIHFPNVRTSLRDSETEKRITLAANERSLIDTVEIENLIPDKRYVLHGKLMDGDTGEAVLVDGEEVTARTTFVPEKSDTTVEVTYWLDATELENRTVVSYQSLYFGDHLLEEHHDINDVEQTVHIPKVRTSAVDTETRDHIALTKNKTTITDVVFYGNLLTGEKYTVTGTLVDSKTGIPVEKDGKPVTASTTFTPEKESGTQEVTFEFDSSDLKGKSVVVFEEISLDGHPVGKHKNLKDSLQTIDFPKVLTAALDGKTGQKMIAAQDKAVITDKVNYENVLAGKTYTVTGKLMDKDTQMPLLIDGKEVTASTEFTAEAKSGTVDVTFEFDASSLGGKTIVVFESIYYNGNIIGLHNDLEDKDQTVFVPGIETTLTDNETKAHTSVADGEVVLTDTVKYEGLIAGKEYTLTGTLVDSENGAEVTSATSSFVPEDSSGEVKQTFTFNGEALSGKTVVAYEKLFAGDAEIAKHEDISDEKQSVHFVKIDTKAYGRNSGGPMELADKDTAITDEVYCYNLSPLDTYIAEGVLMDRETEEPLGNITSHRVFTSSTPDKTLKIDFEFDATDMRGKTTVVYEELKINGVTVASHKDITDADQTVYFPGMRAEEVWDTETLLRISAPDEDVEIEDTVYFYNLMPHEEYVITGTLYNADTGEKITDNKGNEVKSEVVFTPEESSGTQTVLFRFNGDHLEENTIIAYERLDWNGKLIAEYRKEDEVRKVVFPAIDTKASVGDLQEVQESDKVTITDTVTYKNIKADTEYLLTGQLMLKSTGKPIGEKVTKTFTPDSADGTADMELTFDATGLAGDSVVVYEKLTLKETLLAEHCDLEDPDQTITIVEKPAEESAETGDSSRMYIVLLIMTLSAMTAIALRTRRKN